MLSNFSPSVSPAAFLIMRSILSFGTLQAFAFAMQSFNFELELGSDPPPSFTATANSLPILVKIFALAPSVFSFFLLILFHLECPAIMTFLLQICHHTSYHKTDILASNNRLTSFCSSLVFSGLQSVFPAETVPINFVFMTENVSCNCCCIISTPRLSFEP